VTNIHHLSTTSAWPETPSLLVPEVCQAIVEVLYKDEGISCPKSHQERDGRVVELLLGRSRSVVCTQCDPTDRGKDAVGAVQA